MLVLACSSTAAALEDPDTEIARRYFAAGQVAYEARDYQRALERFRAAQRLKPLPAFDYNIGRCLDRLDRPAEAVAAYERYLEREPGADNAAETRDRVRVLRERSPISAPARPRRYLAPGLVLGGALVVAGIAGGLVGSVAPELKDLERSWDTSGRTDALVTEGLTLERRAIAGYALFGVAGALAVADVVLWGLAARRQPSDPRRVDRLSVRF